MSNVTRLVQLLDTQLGTYEVLHDLLARMRGAIETNDLAALAKTAEAIERVIGENNRVEAQRQEAAVHLMEALGIPDHRPTLARLLRRLPEPQREPLRGRYERIRTTLAKLREEADLLRGILRLNVRFTDQMLRNIVGTVADSETYDLAGATAAPEALRLLDRTV